MTPTIFWALLAVTVAVGIALGIGTCIAAGKARDEALGARNEPVHDVALSCHIDGHYYAAYGITGGGAPHAVTTCPAVTANSMARPRTVDVSAADTIGEQPLSDARTLMNLVTSCCR